MGFNNAGLDYFVRNLKTYRGEVPVGANVGANKDSEDRIADYVTGIEVVAPHADYVTINISSPTRQACAACRIAPRWRRC
jgi:dihydroorotate dehydrogenase